MEEEEEAERRVVGWWRSDRGAEERMFQIQKSQQESCSVSASDPGSSLFPKFQICFTQRVCQKLIMAIAAKQLLVLFYGFTEHVGEVPPR